MTREEEFEAALQARARTEEAERLRAHARFLHTPSPDFSRSQRRRAERQLHERRFGERQGAAA